MCKRVLWKLYILLTVGVAAVYFLVGTTSLSELLLNHGIGLSAVVATLYAINKNQPENRQV